MTHRQVSCGGCGSFLPPFFLWGSLRCSPLPGGGPDGGARATASGWWGGALEGLPQIKRKQPGTQHWLWAGPAGPRPGSPKLWDLTPDDLRWSSCNNHGNKVHNKCNAPNHPPLSPKIVFHGSLVPKQLGTPLDYPVGRGGWVGRKHTRQAVVLEEVWSRFPSFPPLPHPARGVAPHPQLQRRAL